MEERYTDIRLLKVPIDIDDKNQINFANATSQYNYFNSCTYIEVSDSSYQRKDSTIRYPGHIDDLIGYNYCMYKNNYYTDKWYYAFITDMKYISDSMTLVTIKTDVWQTWQFDITYKKSFVEREHVADDTIGKHTIPEGLELGEYIVESSSDAGIGTCHAVVITSWDPVNNKGAGTYLNGVPQACNYYVVKGSTENYTISGFTSTLASQGKAESMLGVIVVPDDLTGYSTITNWDSFDPGPLYYSQFKEIAFDYQSQTGAKDMKTVEITKPIGTFGTYTPKNNKMKTYPYKVLMGTNNQGASAEYRFEDFSTTNCTFKIKGCLTPGCSVRMYPENYKNKAVYYEEGLNDGKYPIGSFTSDMYTNWLTQNGVNVPVSIASSAFTTLVGAATGNPVAVGGGIIGIASSIGQVYEHKKIPPQFEGNINAGEVNYASGHADFSFHTLTIKEEYAKICDDFMSMFGYKVNELKVPNITSRTYWNYIKTIECNITGDIPQSDLIEIKNIFNAGVTFWHDPSKFLDYTQSNTIVS